MVELKTGCIIHWENYVFPDGDSADKYLVILGCKEKCNYLAVIATSKPHKRKFDPGCNSDMGYFHIPGGKKDWFPKDTWLLLSEPREISPAELLKFAMARAVEQKGQLREELANAIRNCLKRCDDVSTYHLSLL